jgi:hypothetical protein
MSKNLLWLLLAAAFVMPLGCSSEDDDDTPAPPAPWGPSAIAVGDDALIMVGSFGDMWTNVPAATSGITGTYDIDKVVKVPNSNRLVAIVNDDTSTGDHNAEIWYNDAGGEGAWTKAWYGTSATDYSYLDAAHRPAGLWDDFNLTDIVFLNSTEGYAVGENYVILRTYDAGATWRDLNTYLAAGAATPAFQQLNLSTTVAATLVIGATVTGNVSGSGTILSVNEYDYEVVVSVTAAFTTDTTATVGAGNNTISSIYPNVTYGAWKYQMRQGGALFGIEGAAGTGTLGAHTLWIGQGGSMWQTSGISGVWKVVSNTPATAAARTFTITGPDRGDQYATGQIGATTLTGLFFFDALTGVATNGDGVWYTITGNDWIQFTGTDGDSYNGFVYSAATTAESGYLYSINESIYDNQPGRVAVTYTAGTPATWSFGTTPTAAWVEHATGANYAQHYLDTTGMFLSNGKIFEFSKDSWSSGYWAWCGNFSDSTMDNTLWQDTTEQNMGGTLANGDNSAYLKEIFQTGTTPTSGYTRWVCPR